MIADEALTDGDLGKRKVLVVDDEPMVRTTFKLILSSEIPDMEIETAENGAEAYETFCDIRPNVLLMDLHMPVMDGEEAFDRIMKACDDNAWEKPSVVFCTGYDPSDRLREMVRNEPRHHVLNKPVDGKVIVDIVRSRLES